MDILNLNQRIRIGKYPISFDIHRFDGGFMAEVFNFNLPSYKNNIIELREKEDNIALFVYVNGNELPKWWKNSKILFKNKNKIKI